MLMLYCLAAVKMNHEKMQNGTCIFRKILLYYLTFVKEHSSIAQSVEHAAVNRAVVGSSPTRGVFRISYCVRPRPHGQAVKTSPFHGGNTSSNLVGVMVQLNMAT